MSERKIPDGYMEDALGRLVPLNVVDEYDKVKNDLVMETVAQALELQEDMRRFKAKIAGDIEALVTLAAEKYQAKLGGKKGNISLVSYDGRFKILRAVAETLVMDERLQVAKGLVDECITDWTEGAREELQALINDAFQVDKEGRVNSARILSLRKLKIQDERWKRAMEAISDSLQVAGTSTYFRVYRRDESGKYQPVSLDLAAL